MKVIIKTLEKMPKHTRGKPGAGMYMYMYVRGTYISIYIYMCVYVSVIVCYKLISISLFI